MEVKFNVTGKKRKELATAVAEFIGAEAIYKGVPSCAYEVGSYTIDRTGILIFDGSENTENLFSQLATKGVVTEETNQPSNHRKSEEEPQQKANAGLTVAIPLDKVNIANLNTLLDAKGSLIKKALGIHEFPIIEDEEKIAFPWFETQGDELATRAYTHFIAAMCEMTRNQKRITEKEKEVENEKYAFRCFLLRLGFIGAEFKGERKFLLKNLSGSSAFKNQEQEVVTDEVSK